MFKGLEAHPAGTHAGGKRCCVLTSTKTWLFLQPRVALQQLGMLQLPSEGPSSVTPRGHSKKLGNDAAGIPLGQAGWVGAALISRWPRGWTQHPRAVNVLIIQGLVSDSFNPMEINQIKQTTQELLVKSGARIGAALPHLRPPP